MDRGQTRGGGGGGGGRGRMQSERRENGEREADGRRRRCSVCLSSRAGVDWLKLAGGAAARRTGRLTAAGPARRAVCLSEAGPSRASSAVELFWPQEDCRVASGGLRAQEGCRELQKAPAELQRASECCKAVGYELRWKRQSHRNCMRHTRAAGEPLKTSPRAQRRLGLVELKPRRIAGLTEG